MKADAAPSTTNTDIFGLGYVPPTDANLIDPTSQFQLPLTSGMAPSGTPYDPGVPLPTVDPGTFQTPTPTADPSITSPNINIPTDTGTATATQGMTTSGQPTTAGTAPSGTDPNWLQNFLSAISGGNTANLWKLLPYGAAAALGLSTAKGAQQQATQEAGQLKTASAPFLSGAQRELSQFESQTLTPTQQQFVDFTSQQGQDIIASGGALNQIAQQAFGDYKSGKLPAADELKLQQQVQAQKQQLRQTMANSGTTDSSVLLAYDQQIDNQAAITRQNLLDARFQTGSAAYNQWLNSTTQGIQVKALGAQFAQTAFQDMVKNALGLGGLGMAGLESAIALTIQSDEALSKEVSDLMGNLAAAYAYTVSGPGAGGKAGSGTSSTGNSVLDSILSKYGNQASDLLKQGINTVLGGGTGAGAGAGAIGTGAGVGPLTSLAGGGDVAATGAATGAADAALTGAGVGAGADVSGGGMLADLGAGSYGGAGAAGAGAAAAGASAGTGAAASGGFATGGAASAGAEAGGAASIGPAAGLVAAPAIIDALLSQFTSIDSPRKATVLYNNWLKGSGIQPLYKGLSGTGSGGGIAGTVDAAQSTQITGFKTASGQSLDSTFDPAKASQLYNAAYIDPKLASPANVQAYQSYMKQHGG